MALIWQWSWKVPSPSDAVAILVFTVTCLSWQRWQSTYNYVHCIVPDKAASQQPTCSIWEVIRTLGNVFTQRWTCRKRNPPERSSIIDWSMSVIRGLGLKLSSKRGLPTGCQTKEPAQSRAVQRLFSMKCRMWGDTAPLWHCVPLPPRSAKPWKPWNNKLVCVSRQEPPTSGFHRLSYITLAGACACQLTLVSPVAESNSTLPWLSGRYGPLATYLDVKI